jgi:hypothetical protein
MLSGERPLWLIIGVALAIIVPILAVYVRPSQHERSVRRYQKEWRE